jgi:NADH-quinone oxidoreductase subunit J
VSAQLLIAQAGGELAKVSTGEAVAFWILAPIVLGGALGMIFARNAVHSAMFLVMTMLGLGVMYMIQQAPFLGFAQIIVYTGAIMMLFLFVLMLVGRDSSDSVVEVLRGQRVWAAILGIGLAGLLVGGISRALTSVRPAGLGQANSPETGGNVAGIGRLIFTDYLFAFELTSALLITAALGAMVLGYTDKSKRMNQRETANARFRGEHDRPSPLPGPGVYATANSVAVPALLPDGSVAPESVSAILEATASRELAGDVASVAGSAPAPDAHALKPSAASSDEGKGDK